MQGTISWLSGRPSTLSSSSSGEVLSRNGHLHPRSGDTTLLDLSDPLRPAVRVLSLKSWGFGKDDTVRCVVSSLVTSLVLGRGEVSCVDARPSGVGGWMGSARPLCVVGTYSAIFRMSTVSL